MSMEKIYSYDYITSIYLFNYEIRFIIFAKPFKWSPYAYVAAAQAYPCPMGCAGLTASSPTAQGLLVLVLPSRMEPLGQFPNPKETQIAL